MKNSKAIDIVIVTNLTHLYIVKKAIEKICNYLSVNKVYLITAKQNFKYFKNINNGIVTLLDEDSLIPTMTLNDLKKLKVYNFPKRAGWYYQQLLKYSMAFKGYVTEEYLIWDADTVLLSKLEFIDCDNKYFFTKSAEYNKSYFENYERLLGEKAQREFSFISQHMVVNKSILQEMLQKIEKRIQGDSNWAWKIMENIKGESGSLFSEYETYGHYIKNHYPERCIFRDVVWLRDGTDEITLFPNEKHFRVYKEKYSFVSFEVRSKNKVKKLVLKLYKEIYPNILNIKCLFK